MHPGDQQMYIEKYVENFSRAAEFMRQIKNDGEMISAQNPDKYTIKCLSLNTEAYLH